jgi:hypothetical protein
VRSGKTVERPEFEDNLRGREANKRGQENRLLLPDVPPAGLGHRDPAERKVFFMLFKEIRVFKIPGTGKYLPVIIQEAF